MWKKCCCLCARETYEPPDVQELDYKHSSLTEVPPEIFTYERTLEKLLLGSNQIGDLPPNLFYCHELRELDLCDNELKEIPAAIESLNRLAKLNVCRNALTEVPESIKNCKNLIYLDLSLNQLSKIPESVCQLVHLEELFLNETALDFLPANFGRLTKLKNLELRDNMIVSLPMSMSRLTQLQRLDIGCNDMEELPAAIGFMVNLSELWADDNAMRQDANTKVLGSLPKLTCLDMSKNHLNSVSDQIGKCTNLMDITLSFNDLQEIPSSFTKLENVCTVRVDSNRLSQLPEDIGKLKSLQELNLSFNILTSIPISIGLLRNLHTLYLDGNRLTELPKEIGSCISLSVLSVANNHISEIPSEVGHLSNLKVLVLTNNAIKNLPVSILGLTKLGALWLTEGQNKPLVTLNREIDAVTGQHVVTCCLLPQLPSPDVISRRDDPEENMPPRSGRKIRFESDIEPIVAEKPAINGGLLRAPTPYPKELRAMAKHASHIRQTKTLNGEAINVQDEPIYEGDVHDENGEYQAKQSIELKVMNERQDNIMESYHSQLNETKQYQQLDTRQSEEQCHFSVGLPQQQTYPTVSSIVDHQNILTSAKNNNFTEGPSREYQYEINPRPALPALPPPPEQIVDNMPPPPPPIASSSQLIGRTPPPYHIAAQRAAFLRSSGGAGSGKINFPTEIRNNTSQDAAESSPASPNSQSGTENLGNTVYNPITTKPPQSSGGSMSSQSKYSGGNMNDNISHDSYEPANINAILQQYQYQLNEQPTDAYQSYQVPNNLLAGQTMGDLVDGDSRRPAINGSTGNNNANDFMECGDGLQSDRNGNVTSNKAFTKCYDNSSMYANTVEVEREDVSKEDLMPPAMPLLMSGMEQPRQQEDRHPAHHTEASIKQSDLHTKNEISKVKACRIPSLQNTSIPNGTRKLPPTNLPSPITNQSRIPKMDQQLEIHSRAESPMATKTALPQLRFPQSRGYQESQYGANKPPSTSRIPSGMYSPASSGIKSPEPLHFQRNPGQYQHQPSHLPYNDSGAGHNLNANLAKPDTNLNNSAGAKQLNESLKSYSRIPKLDLAGRSSSSTDDERRSAFSSPGISEKSYSKDMSPLLSRSGAGAGGFGRESDHSIDSKIPRKPWIFGTHRNARVVSVEYRKVNQFKLGFGLSEYSGQNHPEGKGVYITATDSDDLPIKVGDKILQVDGIDVADMGVEIVNKILGNCQENIQLLVSRQQ